MTVSDFVKDNNIVTFDRFRAGFFYYTVKHLTTKEVYEFFVPIEDIGDATLNGIDKALTYMRWIRKAIEDNTIIKLL
jgi:hypothetical protein